MPFITTPLLVIAALLQSAAAYPNGAGACPEGVAAVGAPHLNNPTTGTLATGGFTVSLGGTALVANGASTFSTNTDVALTISGGTFRGFLMRLGGTGGVSTVGALTATGSDIQDAGACTGVGGVTHTSNSVKSTVSTTLNMATPASSMPLDITVVVQNSGGVSEFYYSQFSLTAVNPSTSAPTAAPVLVTTAAPTAAATPAPAVLGVLTPSPVVTPTRAPVTPVPTVNPTLPPTTVPTEAPTPIPTTTPTLRPTPYPSAMPSVDSTCEDLKVSFFVNITGTTGIKDCNWLSGRPQIDLDATCIKSHPAYYICEETCGTCNDGCNDADSTVMFVIDNGIKRTCSWLSDRPRWQGSVCVDGHPAMTLCPETCESCAQPSTAPSRPPNAVTPKPSPLPVTSVPVVTIPPASPSPTTMAPMVGIVCDDQVDVYFPVFVDGVGTTKHCQWLAARKSYQEILCTPSNEAYSICEETCGKCTDTCEDLAGTFPAYKGVERSCAWLADRGVRDRGAYCGAGKKARTICLETCNICD